MSYIPDCRTDENYNEKYINKEDKTFLRGFDWCAEMTVDNFFDNMDVYFEQDSHIMHVLNEELPEDIKGEYTVCESPFMEHGEETRKVETYADLIRREILDYIEMGRDQLITSMIDGMDEDEYKKIKAEVDGRQGKAEN